jgi:hypothetical protein
MADNGQSLQSLSRIVRSLRYGLWRAAGGLGWRYG